MWIKIIITIISNLPTIIKFMSTIFKFVGGGRKDVKKCVGDLCDGVKDYDEKKDITKLKKAVIEAKKKSDQALS